jgi:feruloyl esterase
MKSFTIAGISTLVGSVASYSCCIETIKSFLPANSTVFYATHLAASTTFTPHVADNYGSTPAASGFGGGSVVIPQAGCVVQGNVSLPENTQYSFGLVLPDDWNGRFLYVVPSLLLAVGF